MGLSNFIWCRFCAGLLLLALSIWPVLIAFAACTSPSGISGELLYDSAGNVYKFCNGTNWVNVPIDSALESCTLEGEVQYDSSAVAYKYCDGTNNQKYGCVVGNGEVPTNGLVGHWKLDDGSGTTATDSAGSNDGTLTNGPVWTNGIKFGAVNFDGVDDTIQTSGDVYASAPMSVSLWVNMDNINAINSNVLVCQRSDGTPAWRSWRIFVETDGSFKFSVLDNSGTGNTVVSDNVISTGTWYHVTGVLDSNYNMTMYVNGVLQADTDNSISINPLDGTSMWIGSENSSSKFIDGTIDDVRVYNRALSATEVQNIYTSGGLVGHWKLDESSGSSIVDSSGFGNTGTWSDGVDNDVSGETGSGVVGAALAFDDSNDRIDVSGSAELELTGDITIAAWVNRVASANSDVIVRYGSSGTGEAENWIYSVYLTSSNKINMGWEYGAGNWTDEFSDTTLTTPSGTWSHIAVTRNAATKEVKFYENASQLGGTDTYTSNATGGTSAALVIGADIGSGSVFNGSLDDVRIYNRVLSSTEIQNIYSGCKITSSCSKLGAIDMEGNQFKYCDGYNWVVITE